MECKMPIKKPRLTQQQKQLLEKYSHDNWADFDEEEKNIIASLCDKDLLEFQPYLGNPHPSEPGQVRRKTTEGRNNYCAAFRLSVPSNDKIAEFTTTVSYQGFNDLKSVEGMLVQQFATDHRCQRSAVKIETQHMANNSEVEHSYLIDDFVTDMKAALVSMQYNVQISDQQSAALERRRMRSYDWGELSNFVRDSTGIRNLSVNGHTITFTLTKSDPELIKTVVWLINQFLNECIREYPQDPFAK